MKILLIDGQGGRMGKLLAESILERFCGVELIAVGTNGAATAAMIKGGAPSAATGENAVIVNSRCADIIVGPLGIVIADSMLGEISPAMAVAVGQSRAVKVLIPTFKCGNLVAGVGDTSLSLIISDALDKIDGIINAG